MTYSRQSQIIYQNQDDLDRYQGLKSRILAAKDFTNLSDKDAAQMLLHLGRWEDVRYEAIKQLNNKIETAKAAIISAAKEIENSRQHVQHLTNGKESSQNWRSLFPHSVILKFSSMLWLEMELS